jgi:hypothetical protein
MREDWASRAACKGLPTDWFFPVSIVKRRIVELCEGCPVRAECLEYQMAFEDGETDSHRSGFFAGTYPRDRWRMEKASLAHLGQTQE